MASCQTYASSSHIRHPWFDTVVMKRKHRETVSPDEDTLSSKTVLPPPKRLRFTNLENGFAHMSLGNLSGAAPGPSESHPRMDKMSLLGMSGSSMDTDMITSPSTHTSFTHEPSYTVEEVKTPEVQMKTSSWYELEPDRIIITDMDSFTQSDEEDEGSISVNPAFLNRIRNRSLESTANARPKPTPSTSQALVLFKPLLLTESDKEVARTIEERRQRQEPNVDEDAMDVEP